MTDAVSGPARLATNAARIQDAKAFIFDMDGVL